MYIEMYPTGLTLSDLICVARRKRSEDTEFPYAVQSCRCSNCRYVSEGKCSLKECCCMADRVKARTCTFTEILNTCFANVKDNVFHYRLRLAAERAAMTKTCFLDREHRARCQKALHRVRGNDKNLIAQLFVLTATESLWSASDDAVLMGSTFKMGAGTNVQERLIALHDLDVPWRPSDLEQRLGRIVRQGNSNPEVEIYRYVTEGTFDAYMYQLLESKQKFISQIMTSKSPVRCAEDVDDTALSYAEIKALASGNPKIMEKMQLDADVAKLKLQKSAHLSERYMLEDQLFKDFPKEVSEEEERIAGYGADIEIAKENTHKDDKGFSPMIVQGKEITVKAEAGKAILAFCKKMTNPDLRPLGEYREFKTEIGFDIFGREIFMMLRGKLGHRVTLGQDANGIITRLDNAIDSFFTKQCHCKERLAELKQQIENAKREVATPFPREEELTEKLKRLDELNAELNMDKPENELVDGERDGDETASESKESRPENDRQEREQDDDREEECR